MLIKKFFILYFEIKCTDKIKLLQLWYFLFVLNFGFVLFF